MNIVLFHKDLRISDHQPLVEAVKMGEVLPLYVFEPSVWKGTALSARHFQFVLESLEALTVQIEDRGGKLFFANGEMKTVLADLLDSYGSITLFTHKETARKDAIADWIDVKRLRMVTYGPELDNDTGSERMFKKHLAFHLNAQALEPPKKIEVPTDVPEILFTDLKKLQRYKVKGSKIRFGQQGGELAAMETLDSFLASRFANYILNQQKPIPSSLSSSRLSAYITWGNISERTIFQKTNNRMQKMEFEEERLQLEEFLSKLYLRMKLCKMPMVNGNSTDVGEIKGDWNEEWYQRWLSGKTGIPIIDAAMRSVHKTGWLNFTLRGMLIAFISNTLLLDPRKPSKALAELLLDYEPGIHDFYVQQQAGVSGKLKIINPVKIGKQHDPEGAFIRRYVPELTHIPEEYIHEPWTYPGFYKLGYETPIVDVVKANKYAKLQLRKLLDNGKKHKVTKNGETEQLSFDL
jgi:deoxyribodipyrimidine photo-lyase